MGTLLRPPRWFRLEITLHVLPVGTVSLGIIEDEEHGYSLGHPGVVVLDRDRVRVEAPVGGRVRGIRRLQLNVNAPRLDEAVLVVCGYDEVDVVILLGPDDRMLLLQ